MTNKAINKIKINSELKTRFHNEYLFNITFADTATAAAIVYWMRFYDYGYPCFIWLYGFLFKFEEKIRTNLEELVSQVYIGFIIKR